MMVCLICTNIVGTLTTDRDHSFAFEGSANLQHIARHDVTPEEAEQVVQNDPFDAPVAIQNGEARTVHLGETDANRILVVVVTNRAGMHRVVTARPANKKERAFYSQHKASINDQDTKDP